MSERMREAFLEFLSRVLAAVAARLPALLAALLILFFAALVASVVRGIVRHLCGRIALDRGAHEWGFAASPAGEARSAAPSAGSWGGTSRRADESAGS